MSAARRNDRWDSGTTVKHLTLLMTVLGIQISYYLWYKSHIMALACCSNNYCHHFIRDKCKINDVIKRFSLTRGDRATILVAIWLFNGSQIIVYFPISNSRYLPKLAPVQRYDVCLLQQATFRRSPSHFSCFNLGSPVGWTSGEGGEPRMRNSGRCFAKRL